MKWLAEDLDVFQREKEYIDTVLLPLVPIQWGEHMSSVVREGRFSLLLSEQLERELKGRVILSPAFTYLKANSFEDTMRQLEAWLNEIQRAGVKSIVTLTSDVDWKIHISEKQTEGVRHIWLPAVPLEHMNPQSQQDFLDEMVGSVLKQIAEVWQTVK
ncbi:MAG TPA: DUF2487 family protein [Sporolactobacillaceae bacterium]|nr:DUF2487 family protein [Sporolactobacillaceae bacterium]